MDLKCGERRGGNHVAKLCLRAATRRCRETRSSTRNGTSRPTAAGIVRSIFTPRKDVRKAR